MHYHEKYSQKKKMSHKGLAPQSRNAFKCEILAVYIVKTAQYASALLCGFVASTTQNFHFKVQSSFVE